MQRITRARLVLSLALVGALALAGCGGDDAYNISAEDQARIDTLTDDVAAANKKAADDLAAAKTQAEADLKAAQDEIDSLTAQIGMAATDDMAATGLHKQLADARAAATTAQMTIGELNATIGMMPGDDGMGGSGLQGDLAMYKATAADLQDTLGMMADGDMAATGLYKELADAQDKVAGLEGMIGMMADGDMAATGLYKELADAQDKVAGLEGMIGAAPGDDGMGGSGLEADLAKYKGMVGDLEMKIGMMDDPTTTEADESSGLYKQLADAMAEAQMYKDMVGMEADGDNPEATGLYKMIADAEAKATMYKAQLDALQGTIDTGEMAGASAMAKTLYTVLDGDVETGVAGADATDITNIIGGNTTTLADNLMVGIENGMLTVKIKDYTMADDAPAMIGEDWRGATAENKARRRTVTVYSDRGTDGGLPLFDVYDPNPREAGKPRSYPIVNTDTPNDDTDIEWSVVRRPDGDTTGGADPGSAMFMGSVRGVPGTFTCPTTCTAPSRHSDDTVTATAVGTWTFVPDDPSVAIEEADGIYLTFGWWLTKDAGGTPTGYGLVTMDAGMADATDNTTPGGGTDGLVGTATYKGAAAGKYALPSTTDGTYTGGHFTAMATIEADFDADGTTAKDSIALSGTIDNFMTGDESYDWTVKLMVDSDTATPNVMDPIANLGTDSGHGLDNTVNSTVGLTTEWSMGASAATAGGAWEPTFHYKPFAPNVTTGIPDAVTGTFNAMGSIGNLQGAFGANKVME